MPSPDQIKKELDHIFLNLFESDPWDEEDWNEKHLIFMEILSEMALKHGIGAIVLLSHEELREILREVQAKASDQGTSLCFYLSGKVNQLQFHLKNLQEKRMFSFDSSFDYSSFDELDFRKFSWDQLALPTLAMDGTLALPHHLRKNMLRKKFLAKFVGSLPSNHRRQPLLQMERKPQALAKRLWKKFLFETLCKKIHMELNHLIEKLMKLTS